MRTIPTDVVEASWERVVLVELMSDDEDQPELANENMGLAFLYLKSVIDCLDGGVSLENSGGSSSG